MRPRFWCVGLGLLAVLAGSPAMAQALNAPAAAPEEAPLASPSGTPPATSSAPAPAAATQSPASPFGAQPGVFPAISPAPAVSDQPASSSGPAAGVFPGEAPAPSTSSSEPGAATTPAVAAPPLLTPGYGFGFPSAPLGAATAAGALAPQAAPSSIGLQPLRPGALPVQAQNIRAPPILILPKATLSEGYTDNPRNTSKTLSDSLTTLNAGTTISVDTLRLQGQLTGSIDYQKFARASDQDNLNANLLGYGLGTIVKDHVFVDGRAAITQVSRAGSVGFASSSVIPASQQTQTEVVSLSPILRHSIGDAVDSELRYNYGVTLFQNGSLAGNSTTTAASPAVPSTSLSNTTQNEATLSLATSRRFTLLSSKLTLDASRTDSQSSAKSTTVRGFDDLQYKFNEQFSALGRVGYEDIRYPLQPSASTKGVIWTIGGQVTPFPGSNLTIHYGHQNGFDSADGNFRYEVTPATTVLGSLKQSLAASQQQILGALNSSQVNAAGTVVNSTTGLPSTLTNPQFSNSSNTVFRNEDASLGIQTTLDRNTFGILAVYDSRTAVGSPTTGSSATAASSGNNTSYGADLNWSRSLTPRLTSFAQLGYAVAVVGHQKTLTADWRLTYIISDTLTGAFVYQFINLNSAIVASSYQRNQVELSVTRSF